MAERKENIISATFNDGKSHQVKKGSVLEVAKMGFDHGSAEYDKSRPNYLKEAIDFIVNEITTETTATLSCVKYNVLELGAGTGKTTQDLVPRLPESTKYLATDPSRNFLGLLQSKMLRVDTALATADNIPLSDSTVQNIVCGQCFHWFPGEENLREMQRVLVPGGKLIIMWKIEVDEDWLHEGYKQRSELYAEMGVTTDNNVPDVISRLNNVGLMPFFSLADHQAYTFTEHQWNLDTYIAYMSSMSAYNALPQGERKHRLDKLRETILSWPGVNADYLPIPFTTYLFVFTPQKQ